MNKFNPRTIVLLFFILIIGAIRTYLSFDENMFGLGNFSPVGAMAIFGGVYFRKSWKAILFPLLALVCSDVVLQLTVHRQHTEGFLYSGWYYVYGSFVLMVLAAVFLKKVTAGNILILSFVSVLIHWLVSDIGVWHGSSKYAQNLMGYFQCLVAAIPFEARFLAGTILYSAVFFGLFEWMKGRNNVLA